MTQPTDLDSDAPQEAYWFNLKKGLVERGLLTPAPDRVGPFATAAEASRALEIIRERARAWQEEESAED